MINNSRLDADNSPEFYPTGKGFRVVHNREYEGLTHDERDVLIHTTHMAGEGPVSAFEAGMTLKRMNILSILRSLASKGYVQETT